MLAVVAASQEAVAAALGPSGWFELGPSRHGWICVWGPDVADATDRIPRSLLDTCVLPGAPDTIVINEKWAVGTGDGDDDVVPGFRVDLRAGGVRAQRIPVASPPGGATQRGVANVLVRLFGDVPGRGTQLAREIQQQDAASAVEHALESSCGDVAGLADRLGFLLPRLPPTRPPDPDRAVLLHRSTTRRRRRSVDASSRWGRSVQLTTLDAGWDAYQWGSRSDTDPAHVRDLAASAAGGDTVVLLERGPGTARADVQMAGHRRVRTWDGWLRSTEQGDPEPGDTEQCGSRWPVHGGVTDPLVDVVRAVGIPPRALLLLDAPHVASYDEVRTPVSFLRVVAARFAP
ncbi:MAG: hypothetical protein PIR53_08700 [Nocardioides alkalitolerans]